MTSNIEAVKRMNEACVAKDFDAIEAMLHPEYTFKDPTMTFDNPKDFMEFMKNCPSDGTVKATSIMEDGDTVIQIVDCEMTKPEKFKMHMCDILKFKDGKVIAEEVFYDTATVPESAKSQAAQGQKNKRAA